MRLSSILSGLLFVATSLAVSLNHTWEPRDEGHSQLATRDWVGAFYIKGLVPLDRQFKKIAGTFIVPKLYKVSASGLKWGMGITIGLGFGAIGCENFLGAGIGLEYEGTTKKHAWIQLPGRGVLVSNWDFENFLFSTGDAIRITIDRVDWTSEPELIRVSFMNFMTGRQFTRQYSTSMLDLCLADAEWVLADKNSRWNSQGLPEFGQVPWTDTVLSVTDGTLETQVPVTSLNPQRIIERSSTTELLVAKVDICSNAIVVSNSDWLY